MPTKTTAITTFVLAGVTAAWVAYDVWAIVAHGYSHTITNAIRIASKNDPIIAGGALLMVGYWFGAARTKP